MTPPAPPKPNAEIATCEHGSAPDLATIAEAAWHTAQARFAAIQPLLSLTRFTRADVRERARAAGVATSTVYRWLRRFQRSGRLRALLPTAHGGGRDKSRLDTAIEAIVQATIEEAYLSAQKPSVQQTAREVLRRCHNAGLKPPHPNTVRHRIRRLSERVKLRRREGAKASANRFAPVYGAFPDADWPLAVVQIDHTPVDLIVVDDLHRRPIGRPLSGTMLKVTKMPS